MWHSFVSASVNVLVDAKHPQERSPFRRWRLHSHYITLGLYRKIVCQTPEGCNGIRRNHMTTKQKRIKYLFAFLIFLLIEVLIALFVHDDFIRPYIGDVLVVVVIYCFAKIFLPNAKMWLPVAIFIFAALVETLQYFNIVELLGVEDNTFLSTLIGATFDVLLFYLILLVVPFVIIHHQLVTHLYFPYSTDKSIHLLMHNP